jgi:anaerobic dimethyl sulfoxide reductase subunit A
VEIHVPQGGVSRRCFLKLTGLVGSSFAAAFPGEARAAAHRRDVGLKPGDVRPKPDATYAGAERVVRTGCPAHNCGGRCLLVVHVVDGVITRIGTDDRASDTLDAPQLRACLRGRAYRRREYHPDRLLHPLKRVGKRGEARFEAIGWDEAVERVATEITRVRQAHGNAALFVPYGTGSYNQVNGRQAAQRLLNLYGGSLGHYNNYSWSAMAAATESVYGTSATGNDRRDWLNAKLVVMWGWNPAETRDGTNTEHILRQARERGARIVCIDPRMTASAVSLADEWVPIRPGTDAAMLSAMAHVMVTERLHDATFVGSHCLGFDASQMPAGAETAETYEDYLLGRRDRTPKSPRWAEAITGVPAGTIARLAREYATCKPGVLYQGYGLQRRAFGEQAVRAACALAAITGNVGVPGGWAGGLGLQPDGGPLGNVFPTGTNPVKASIPTFLWTEAVVRGPQLTAEHGLRGADRLECGIKLIYAVASNILINQHANINRTAKILADERQVELVVVQDNFLTPSARFADIVLPACTQLETWGVEDGWKYGDELLFMPKVVDAPGEAKSDYAICAAVARRLGIGEAYTEGRSEREWVEWALSEFRKRRYPGLPALTEMEAANLGVYPAPASKAAVAFEAFRKDPVASPLPTPSGRIEIFSARLHALGTPATVPAVPKYIQEWESPFGAEARRFPLQLVTHHTLARAHSTFAGVDWLEEAFPQRLFINPADATARAIENGDEVRVFNERGEMVVRCRVTRRIMPGVAALPQGAWWKPGRDGVDEGGSANVLTSERWTPLAFANTQHTVMVEVKKRT